MSRGKIIINYVDCDHPDCADAFEGLGGQKMTTVKSNAMAAGWLLSIQQDDDRCPRHSSRET